MLVSQILQSLYTVYKQIKVEVDQQQSGGQKTHFRLVSAAIDSPSKRGNLTTVHYMGEYESTCVCVRVHVCACVCVCVGVRARYIRTYEHVCQSRSCLCSFQTSAAVCLLGVLQLMKEKHFRWCITSPEDGATSPTVPVRAFEVRMYVCTQKHIQYVCTQTHDTRIQYI